MSTYGNYSDTASVRTWHIACMDGNTDAKLVFDFLAFCGLEESAGVTMNVLGDDGAEHL